MARRYEFYFRVAKTIFYSLAALVRKILFCHSKIKFISSSRRVMFFLLYRQAEDGVFDDFPKISDHLTKISEDFPKLFWIPDERSRTFSENFRRCPKTSEEDPKMFRWYTNEFKYNVRDKPDVIERSINSRVRLWKINHSGPGCSFYEFYEWYIFQ